MASSENITAVEGPASSIFYDQNLQTVFTIVQAANIVLILTLNPLFLTVIYRVADLQPATRVFMSFLSLSDLGMGLFALLPKTICNYWYYVECLEINSVSLPLVFFCIFFILCSHSLVFLTIDRYLIIAHCLQYPHWMTLRRSLVAVACSLVLAIVIPATGSSLRINEIQSIMIFLFLGTMLIALVAILALNLHVLVIARRQARRIAQENQAAGRGNGPPRISIKAFTTVTCAMVLITLGWFPYIVTVLLSEKGTYNLISDYFTLTLFCMTNWADGIILYMPNRQFRKVLYKMMSACITALRRKCKCTQV